MYTTVWLSCMFYALWRGGFDEYVGVIWFAILHVTSKIAFTFFDAEWSGLTTPIFFIDAIGFLGFLNITLRSDRYWPVWATAWSFGILVVHFIDGSGFPMTKWAAATGTIIWAYMISITIAVGAREYKPERDV